MYKNELVCTLCSSYCDDYKIIYIGRIQAILNEEEVIVGWWDIGNRLTSKKEKIKDIVLVKNLKIRDQIEIEDMRLPNVE